MHHAREVCSMSCTGYPFKPCSLCTSVGGASSHAGHTNMRTQNLENLNPPITRQGGLAGEGVSQHESSRLISCSSAPKRYGGSNRDTQNQCSVLSVFSPPAAVRQWHSQSVSNLSISMDCRGVQPCRCVTVCVRVGGGGSSTGGVDNFNSFSSPCEC